MYGKVLVDVSPDLVNKLRGRISSELGLTPDRTMMLAIYNFILSEVFEELRLKGFVRYLTVKSIVEGALGQIGEKK